MTFLIIGIHTIFAYILFANGYILASVAFMLLCIFFLLYFSTFLFPTPTHPDTHTDLQPKNIQIIDRIKDILLTSDGKMSPETTLYVSLGLMYTSIHGILYAISSADSETFAPFFLAIIGIWIAITGYILITKEDISPVFASIIRIHSLYSGAVLATQSIVLISSSYIPTGLFIFACILQYAYTIYIFYRRIYTTKSQTTIAYTLLFISLLAFSAYILQNITQISMIYSCIIVGTISGLLLFFVIPRIHIFAQQVYVSRTLALILLYISTVLWIWYIPLYPILFSVILFFLVYVHMYIHFLYQNYSAFSLAICIPYILILYYFSVYIDTSRFLTSLFQIACI
jgi:hypothetical protein